MKLIIIDLIRTEVDYTINYFGVCLHFSTKKVTEKMDLFLTWDAVSY